MRCSTRRACCCSLGATPRPTRRPRAPPGSATAKSSRPRRSAEKAGGKKLVETLLFRAALFLDKYDPGHAGEMVKEAQKLAPRDPRVHVAMARVKLENAMDFEAAESEVRQALEVNPELASAYF